MKKVYISAYKNFYLNKYLIDYVSPTGTNKFKNIEITEKAEDADYLFIVGTTKKSIINKFPKEKIICLRVEHPQLRSVAYPIKDGLDDIAFYSPRFFYCTMLNRDFSFLKRARISKKTHKCACYISSKMNVPQHKNRYKWLLRYTELYPNDIDVFSRFEKVKRDFKKCFKEIKQEKPRVKHWQTGHDGAFKYNNLSKYNFSLALDNDMGIKNWFSDHLFDPILCYCFTLYCGSPNISDYLDMKSIFQFRTDDESSFEKVHKMLNYTVIDANIISSIEKNRNIILDDLNFFNLINREVEKREA